MHDEWDKYVQIGGNDFPGKNSYQQHVLDKRQIYKKGEIRINFHI